MDYMEFLNKKLSPKNEQNPQSEGVQNAPKSDESVNSLFVENSFAQEKGEDGSTIFTLASSDDLKKVDYEKLLAENSQADTNLGVVLKDFFSFESVKKAADTDNDGTLSAVEAQAYIENIASKDGKVESLTMNDLQAVIEEQQIDLAVVQFKAIDGQPEAEVPQDQVAEQVADATPQSSMAEQFAQVQKAQSFGSVSSTRGSSYGDFSASFSGFSSLTPEVKTLDTMTLDELKEEKTKRETKLSEKQKELNAINNGENEKVKAALKKKDEAKLAYEEALKNDSQLKKIKSDEKVLKVVSQIDANQAKLDKNTVQINDKEVEISNQEDLIANLTEASTSLKSVQEAFTKQLADLKSSLGKLGKPTGKPENKSADDKLKAKIDEFKTKIGEKENKLNAKKKEVADKQKELTAANKKLETLKKDLESLNKEKTKLEQEKKKLNDEKAKLETDIAKNCTASTKAKMDTYNKAIKNVDEVKAKELATAKTGRDDAMKAVKEVNTKITEANARKISSEARDSKFDFNFSEVLTDRNRQELDKVKKIFEQNKEKYEYVAQKTGVPAELICAIHYRESGCKFDTYLHNGDPLGAPTVHVPRGKFFSNWTDAAIDAIKSENPSKVKDGDFKSCCEFAERYNGLGYRKRGLVSPYVWAGTSNYTGGMYVADGQFSSTAKDKRVGIAVMMKHLSA